VKCLPLNSVTKRRKKIKSELMVHPVKDNNVDISNTSSNFRFAASVAGFAMLLRNSEYKGNINYAKVINMANASIGNDMEGYRKEFVTLVKKTESLKNERTGK
jgi:Ca-activated chloride channel family protein